MEVLGIDIGGSGIKGALVNAKTGEMLTKKHRIPTPKDRKPKDIAKVVAEIVEHFNHKGPVGIGFPTIIKHGICKSPGNLHKKWLGVNVKELFSASTGLDVTVINDADAAGYASISYGTAKGKKGLVLMITIGTGLGSGAFFNGKLIPNFELGQIPYKKYTKIEQWASDSAREQEGLPYQKWGKRLNTFLEFVEMIVAPELIILGGGSAKHFEEYKNCITIETPVVPAKLKNSAGIIGAAASAIQ